MLKQGVIKDLRNYSREVAIQEAVLVSQIAYLYYSRARMTFCPKDMLCAEEELFQAIYKIQEIVYQSVHEYQALDEFDELQELEGSLRQALEWLVNIHAAIGAGAPTNCSWGLDTWK